MFDLKFGATSGPDVEIFKRFDKPGEQLTLTTLILAYKIVL